MITVKDGWISPKEGYEVVHMGHEVYVQYKVSEYDVKWYDRVGKLTIKPKKKQISTRVSTQSVKRSS